MRKRVKSSTASSPGTGGWSKRIPITLTVTREVKRHPFSKGMKRSLVLSTAKEIVSEETNHREDMLDADTVPSGANTAEGIDRVEVFSRQEVFRCKGCEQLEGQVEQLKGELNDLRQKSNLVDAEILIRDTVKNGLNVFEDLVTEELEPVWGKDKSKVITLKVMALAYDAFTGLKISRYDLRKTEMCLDDFKYLGNVMEKVLENYGLTMDDFATMNNSGIDTAKSLHKGTLDIFELKTRILSLQLDEDAKVGLVKVLDLVSHFPKLD